MAFKIKPKGLIIEPSPKRKVDKDLNCNGVYLIHNKVNNKNYVGSTTNLDRRIKNHKQHLEKGCHNNRKIQKDYDEYGPESFEFKILEKNIEEELLTAYEKYHMYMTDAIVMYKGYNVRLPGCIHSNFQYVCKIKKESENNAEKNR